MPGVVGVRFKRAGRVYYFDPAGIDIQVGEHVVVETAQGKEVGWVVIAPNQVLLSQITEPLKPVLRKATPEDMKRREELRARADEALALCAKMARDLSLEMKPVEVQCTLEGDKLSLVFAAEERVDFRQLLKQLSGALKTRVELRQIGPRDETKVLGGVGRCGLGLCCSNWMTDFQPITIKMAKEQGLPLNPQNLAGQCGRLRCCLRYEHEQYRELRKHLPRPGARVMTNLGEAIVVSGHPLKQTATLALESGAVVELPLAEIEAAGHRRPPTKADPTGTKGA